MRRYSFTSSAWYLRMMIIARFLHIWHFTPWKLRHSKNPMEFFSTNFYVNLKNVIGFALAIWESANPAPYFEKMVTVSTETTDWLGDYLIITLTWWGCRPMHSLWEFDQSPKRRFCGTKKFRVERKSSGWNRHFYLLWVIFCKTKRLWAMLYEKLWDTLLRTK